MLNKHNLNVAHLASSEESRYTLRGIRVTQNETVATDGHVLIRVSTPKAATACQFPVWEGFQPGDDFQPFILDRDDALKIAKALPKRSTVPALTCAAVDATKSNANGHAFIGVTDLDSPQVFQSKKVDGQFPNVDAVMPDPAKFTLTVGIDANLLMAICKQVIAFRKESNPRGPCPVKLSFQDNQSGIQFSAEGGDDQTMIGVVMPVRV